ncbi:MAG: CehA/McbA family metallohydrolase [bacterium]|nr:CehA/McbA family metallohydrolase [bacterium]
MAGQHDGPASGAFEPVLFGGNTSFAGLAKADVSPVLRSVPAYAPTGSCTAWGIPFQIRRPLLVQSGAANIDLAGTRAGWLVFLHTTDVVPRVPNQDGFTLPYRGDGALAEHVADYVFRYADGSEVRQEIRRRHQIGTVQRIWGENCFEAVAMSKPRPIRPFHEQRLPAPPAPQSWGLSQARALAGDTAPFGNWLWAWENPHPRRALAGVTIEHRAGTLLVCALSGGRASAHPLRWQTRKKAQLRLGPNEDFDFDVDESGLLKHVRLDMGQVISAQPHFDYPDAEWTRTRNNQAPRIDNRTVTLEYSAHPDARFHLSNGRSVPVAKLESGKGTKDLRPIAAATQRVKLRVVDAESGLAVPVKLHAHGDHGEYLAPTDRHRIPNSAWFEDYSPDYVAVDFQSGSYHLTTYIQGETLIDLPLGRVYLEVSKGFETKPVRKAIDVKASTRTVTIRLKKVLPWRERGWVTADTHVHFLSPATAQLEGAAEGVNVINLLASQWGELMTNVGDFDGKTTYGSREAGGDGEWLVRVGTENRQHVLGHISLLGYNGDIITPMCSGGPDEAAIGDPVGVLMTEWARQCRSQDGIVVFPHFPQPRAENAATLVHGDVDAVEMCSWGDLYRGIDPYSLSDWYRYLNCGYLYPAVGGTDKMAASTAVGTIRTYAKLPEGVEFSYDAWKDAIRAGNTFVSYGPLVEFSVEGRPAGSRIEMAAGGGRVSVDYELASVTLPMTRVDLIVNGEIRESRTTSRFAARGSISVDVESSSWVALLVRGKYADKPEMIAAHSSPVMVHVEGTRVFSKVDAITILDQIEGALAYLDTVGTRAEAAASKRMRLVLTSAHRKLHNEMHQKGHDHVHAAPHHHPEHS